MNQILLVAKREFLTQVKNKTFLIMTFLSPLIIAGVAGIVVWMMSANTDQKNIAVVDQSGEFITSLPSKDNVIYNFYNSGDIEGIKDTLLESSTLNGLLVIPKLDSNDYASLEKGMELTVNGNIGLTFKDKLESKLNKRLTELKMEKEGISSQQMDNIKSSVSVKTFNLKAGAADKEESGDMLKFGLALFLAYITFTFIMIYGVKVMRTVVEEKNTRVVEIIISSVKPFNLMMGKILGTTFVAFTQFGIWILMGLGLFFGASALLASKIDLAEIQSGQTMEMMPENAQWMTETQDVLAMISDMNLPFIIIMFLIYFLLGYIFYSSVFAAIGSAVDNESDTQQFTFYPIFPMIIAMYGSMTAMDNPDGPVSFWLSMIPFTSPISMVTRLAYGVPWWQLALSLAILIGTTLLMVHFAARIYRVGILMYGKKPSFKEMWKWMRYNG